MEPTIISVWSLLQEIILGVGANELHRQLVNRLQKGDAASPDFQEALYHSLLRAVDTLGKALSTEDLPYFQSISDLRDRREEQQRVKEIFNTIQARFPTTSTLNQPVELLLEDSAQPAVSRFLDKLGLENDLESLPDALRNGFQANLPLAMLAHFRQRVATEEDLCALLQLDVTTAGFRAVQRELHAISTFLRQRCGSDDPARIEVWSEDLTTGLKTFVAKEFAEVKDEIGEVKEAIASLEGKVEELPRKILTALSAIYDPQVTLHLRPGFHLSPGPSTLVGASLPYHQLGGPGLERLCYLLLLDKGKVPRYFGKPGQKQYGIDLLVAHGDETTVYQCKNVQSFPLQDMQAALQIFETEWLGRPELPRPTDFVLCCPLPLRELRQNEAWTRLEQDLWARKGVRVAFWDRQYLDERLLHLPDVVADLFSDRVAEQFCNLYDWNSDLFRPLVAGSGEKTVDHYLALKEAGRLYVEPKLEESFTRKLEVGGSLLIQGLPGSGKTITGLALAETLRHRQGPYRIFYISLRHDLDEDTLVQGIRRRLTQPTIFLLDDCHGKYELLERVNDRLRPILVERPSRGVLIFAARTTPTPEGVPRGDYSAFETDLIESESVLEFQPTPLWFRHIIALAKPHFAGLSNERLHKIFEFTGHDLLLLDQLLEMLGSPAEVDQLAPERLFEKTLVRYFGSPTVYRPGFMKLAALAQFDLAPPVASFGFNLDQEDKRAASQLVIIAGRRPPRYHFLHSSAAELIFRALAWNAGADDHPALAADHLVAFFRSHPGGGEQLVKDLTNAIHNRLKLERGPGPENLIRSRLLADEGIYTLIESVFEKLTLNSLAVCLDILQRTDKTTSERYHDLIQRKVEDGSVLKMAMERPFWESGLFLRLAKRKYPELLSGLRSQLVDHEVRSLVQTTELQSILALLANLPDPDNPWWASSLDSVPNDEFERMIQRALASGRSIGTIHLALWELNKADPTLLERLERKIGAGRYLRLITGAGTIFELFMIIKHSSPFMAGELIEALDSETVDALIAQTIRSGRSIGTIDLALRELKKADPTLLERLERKIGAERYLRLITGAGTIFELFRMIQYSSPFMVGELIEALDSETVDALITQTIRSGRSIGTIDLALRELKKADPTLLERLERKIGAERYLHLVTGAGTISELFRMIRHSSLFMAGELIEALDSETVDALVAQSIASGRSIGTIELALRGLRKADPILLERLERKIQAPHWWQLICAEGTMQILQGILRRLSESSRQELVKSSQELTLGDWQKLVLRSNFVELCNFVRWTAPLFSAQLTPAFLDSLEPTFETLIRREDWKGLARGSVLLRDASESSIRQDLLALLRDYVAPVNPDTLHFELFDEATACLSLLWDYLPSRRQELSDSVLAILPGEDKWYNSERFLRSACTLFAILAHPHARRDDACRVLNIGNDQAVAALCAEATTLEIFFYLWNLYSLWFQWEQEGEKSFAGFLHPAIWDAVTAALLERFAAKVNRAEEDSLVALSGFISFSGLVFNSAERADWASSLPPFERLVGRAWRKTFIQAVFFLFGLEWIFDRQGDIYPRTWQWVLPKAVEWGEESAALKHLCRLVRDRATISSR